MQQPESGPTEPLESAARGTNLHTQVREATRADAEGIAHVNVDTWRATYAGIIPDAFLASLSYQLRAEGITHALAQPPEGRFLYVAQVPDGKIVGHASGGPERTGDADFTGELYALYVLPAYQGQGIGRRLLLQVTARLAAAGRNSLLIWVLAANPSRRFYEGLGGQPVRMRTIEIGGATLEEVGYGWLDTSSLLAQELPRF